MTYSPVSAEFQLVLPVMNKATENQPLSDWIGCIHQNFIQVAKKSLQTEGRTGGQLDGMGGQTDRQTDKQREREREREKYILYGTCDQRLT